MDKRNINVVCIFLATSWMTDGVKSFSLDMAPRFQEVERGGRHTMTCVYAGFNLPDVLRIEVVWMKHVYGEKGSIYKASNQTLSEDGFSEDFADYSSFPENLKPSTLEGSSIKFPAYGYNHSITFLEVKLTDSTNYSCEVRISLKGSGDWIEGPESPQSQLMIDGFGQPGITLWRFDRSGRLVKYGEENQAMTVECLYSASAPNTTTFRLFNGTQELQCTQGFHLHDNVTHCTTAVMMSRYDNNKSEWRCQAGDRGYNTTSFTIVVEVKFKPETVYLSKEFPVKPDIGSVVKAICETPSSNPSVIIEWRKDRNLILQSAQLNITRLERPGEFNANHSYSILSFSLTKDWMGSSYSCFVDQQPYLKSDETVIERQVFIEGYSGPQPAGSTLSLSCSLGGDDTQHAKFRWQFIGDGQTEPKTIAKGEHFTKKTTTTTDSGGYICQSYFQKKTFSAMVGVEVTEVSANVAGVNQDTVVQTISNDTDWQSNMTIIEPGNTSSACSRLASVPVVFFLFMSAIDIVR